MSERDDFIADLRYAIATLVKCKHAMQRALPLLEQLPLQEPEFSMDEWEDVIYEIQELLGGQ